MDMFSWIYSFLILISVRIEVAKSQQSEAQLFGLFTLTGCSPEMKAECENAIRNKESILKVHQQNKYWFKTNLCFKDMKNDSRTLIDTLLPLVVDENYSNIQCENEGGIYKQSGHTIVIFTYLSFELTRLVSSLILPQNSFNLVSVTDRPMYPSYLFDHPLSIYSYEAGFGVDMHKDFIKIKNKLNITYMAFFNLQDANQTSIQSTQELCATNPSASAMCIYVSLNPTDCYKELNVDIDNQTSIDNALELLTQYNFSFILQAGNSASISTFQRNAGLEGRKMKDKFYLPFTTKKTGTIDPDRKLSYRSGTVLTNFQGSQAVNHFLRYAFDLPSILIREFKKKQRNVWELLINENRFQERVKKIFLCFLLKRLDKTYKCDADITLDQFFKVPNNLLELALQRMLTEPGWIEFLIGFWKSMYYIANVSPENILREEQWSFNPSIALKARPYCNEKKPFCPSGYELEHSFYTEDNWAQSYGWNCKFCAEKFYKPHQGNEQQCQECYYPNTVNSNRTICYNPFTEVTLKTEDSRTLIVIIPSALMTLLNILAMVVFLIKRESPIVKLSNRKMTTIQLINHFLLFTLPNFLFLHTTPTMCISRQIFLGIAFSITLSINISKSQKLYMIVTSKLIMSHTEILITKASEWLIIMVAVIFNMILSLLYFLMTKPVTVEGKYIDATLTTELSCSNDIMIYVQLVAAAVLSICNGVQGFRARKLPSRFQETNHVIYSSFISTIVFVSATAAYFSQESMINQSFIVLLVTTIYNATHFLLLYSYKLFIMIFRPYLNTREAFEKIRIQEITGNNNSKPLV